MAISNTLIVVLIPRVYYISAILLAFLKKPHNESILKPKYQVNSEVGAWFKPLFAERSKHCSKVNVLQLFIGKDDRQVLRVGHLMINHRKYLPSIV